MKANELTTEIKDFNLTYLMLAQQMVIADKDMAIFRLGISKDIADILEVLTPGQILKLANSNMMLCRIRFDDNLVFGMLANYTKDKFLIILQKNSDRKAIYFIMTAWQSPALAD